MKVVSLFSGAGGLDLGFKMAGHDIIWANDLYGDAVETYRLTVIRAIYDAVEQMGFRTGNILEPSCGVGNFFGMLPESMAGSRLYGVELDSISGRIARQLYPKADITVAGFETTDRRDFYDLAIGNVPFGQYAEIKKDLLRRV